MLYRIFTLSSFIFISFLAISQPVTLQDDFEGNGNITWVPDACQINTSLSNPFPQGINNSATVMEYHDQGGQYANVRFDAGFNLNLAEFYTFSLKIYVPSSGITGSQPNQISLKLQNNNLAEPWTTQTEVIKPVVLDQWQEIQFDFKNDPYTNFAWHSPAPTQRGDLNRILLQINGENNNDQVIAYIDDFHYLDSTQPQPVYNHLVWSDEFNGNGAIDTSKWFHQTQLPIPGSWFNGEIQHYTDRTVNSFQENGVLKIVAKKESYTDQGHTKQYTSARLNSKFAFTYGRVEIMAKLPTGVGTWPAIWMLGKNINENGAYWQTQGFGTKGWPECGEIDIMEHWGNNQDFVTSATHTPSSFGATVNYGGQLLPGASTGFHLYALEWTPDRLTFSVDSAVHLIYSPDVKNDSTWPFDKDQYLLLNIAIEASIDPAFTESAMEIDYLRVYQQNPLSTHNLSEENSLKCFPNPVSDQLTIQLKGAEYDYAQVLIYDLNGAELKKHKTNLISGQLHLTTDDLKRGMYLIKLKINDREYRSKFVKD